MRTQSTDNLYTYKKDSNKTSVPTIRTVFLIRMVEAVVVPVAAIGVWNASSVFALKQPRPARGLGLLLRVAGAVALVLVQYHAEGAPAVPGDLRQAVLVWHAKAEVGAVSVAGVAGIIACRRQRECSFVQLGCVTANDLVLGG